MLKLAACFHRPHPPHIEHLQGRDVVDHRADAITDTEVGFAALQTEQVAQLLDGLASDKQGLRLHEQRYAAKSGTNRGRERHHVRLGTAATPAMQ